MFGFLNNPIARVVELLLAILGFLFGAYHLWEAVFAESKSVSASYRPFVMARGNETFKLNSFVRPDLIDSDRVVDVNFILWNSGREIIARNDIRNPGNAIRIELDKSSTLVDAQPGKSMSSIPNNFELKRQDSHTFLLSWQALDPGDYFESHFLIGTTLQGTQLDDVIKVNGSITGTRGNVVVSALPFRSRQRLRIGIFSTTGIIFFFGLVRLMVVAFPEVPFTRNLQGMTRHVVGYPVGLIMVGACGAVAFFVSLAVMQFLVPIPEWTSFSFLGFQELRGF